MAKKRKKRLGPFGSIESKQRAERAAAQPRPLLPTLPATTSFQPFINIMQYKGDDLLEAQNVDPKQVPGFLAHPSAITWVDLEGVHVPSFVEALTQTVELHPLTTEDILNCQLLPQFESYPGYFFFSINMIYLALDENQQKQVVQEHISLVLKDRVVVSFQEKPGDAFYRIRERIRATTAKHRLKGADYLLYSLLDSIVDGYLVVVDSIAERIDALEDELRSGVHETQLEKIFDLRREILYLRKTIYPVRDMLSKAAVEGGVFQHNTQVYVRDLTDHLTQVTDAISSSAEMCKVLIDTYHSMMNQKMNSIMKTLTMISTIFLPLNFIAGVYGMNFKHMPELEQRWGYPLVLLSMALVTGTMLLIFVRRRWLFDSRRPAG